VSGPVVGAAEWAAGLFCCAVVVRRMWLSPAFRLYRARFPALFWAYTALWASAAAGLLVHGSILLLRHAG
jgi:hypothetical protein